jgi:hypothetical protein
VTTWEAVTVGDLLRQGSQWLEQMRTTHCSSPVTYRRGEEEHEVNATFGRTEYEVADDYGLTVGAQVTDFLLLAVDFPFNEPQPGDRIVADGVVYEVLSLAGQGHWRWSDPYRTTMRVHAKEVGAE